MDADRFAQPVSIFIGLGFPHDVESASEAYRVLNEWTGGRGPAHTFALDICRAAMAGQDKPENARLAFEAFARSRGILAPDALVETASRAAEEWLAA
jgi:hypothetical protein